MTASPEKLAQRCAAIVEGAGAAIGWIAETRGTSQRLEREGDSLTERLRHARNLCRRLGAAAKRPMSVGFFGMSQAGKSYMISSLARGANGKLETVLDGERLDFIDHINPPGGGKEATGLVTRFTRNPSVTAPGFPVHLVLLNEADLVKLLGNSFFCDFDREKVTFNTDTSRINALLTGLKARRQSVAQSGLTEDDVTDIRDYFGKRFKKSMDALPPNYWPTAIALAPYLLPQDRAELFSVLWGEFPEFIVAYGVLRQALAALSHAAEVNAPTSALVERVDGEYTQAASIMNVDAVRCRFAQDSGDLIDVVPVVDGVALAPVRIQRSILAALTKEMVCVLAEPSRVDLFETVDLLDFPGYRGRMGLAKVSEAATQDEGANATGALLLRGKVAYLFERYTDDQEMNVLILCNASDQQINITDLGPVLDSWVWATQGASPEERAKRTPGLLYALTKLDTRLLASLNQTDSNLSMKWSGMIDAVLLERFGKNEWVQHWANGKAFDNLFLVR
ncbi:MAG: virulence factor SrfC family protein, partial [Rhodospirillaceae bacterium]